MPLRWAQPRYWLLLKPSCSQPCKTAWHQSRSCMQPCLHCSWTYSLQTPWHAVHRGPQERTWAQPSCRAGKGRKLIGEHGIRMSTALHYNTPAGGNRNEPYKSYYMTASITTYKCFIWQKHKAFVTCSEEILQIHSREWRPHHGCCRSSRCLLMDHIHGSGSHERVHSPVSNGTPSAHGSTCSISMQCSQQRWVWPLRSGLTAWFDTILHYLRF
jgi:hypothetical protein